jgi:hypothetical protein
MSTDVYTGSTGRAISTYDLLNEMQNTYGLNRHQTHESILAFLTQIIDIDGEDAVVEATRPVRPELLENNPADVDIDYWTTITDAAAGNIRDAFAATYPADEDNA